MSDTAVTRAGWLAIHKTGLPAVLVLSKRSTLPPGPSFLWDLEWAEGVVEDDLDLFDPPIPISRALEFQVCTISPGFVQC